MPHILLIPSAKILQLPYILTDKDGLKYLKYFTVWGWPITHRLDENNDAILEVKEDEMGVKRGHWKELWKREALRRLDVVKREARERRKREAKRGGGRRVCEGVVKMQRMWLDGE